MITDINQLDVTKKYTYADYLTWQFKERVELIRGRLFKMSPAPNRKHQRIVMDISGVLWLFFQDKPCSVFPAPFDVRLPILNVESGKNHTVVQPDITVVGDESKLDEQGCNGAPDLVIEVLSPGNTKIEMQDKYSIYEESGVKEYWLVEPKDEFIIIYSLNDEGHYTGSRPHTKGDVLTTRILPGFELNLNDLFQ